MPHGGRAPARLLVSALEAPGTRGVARVEDRSDFHPAVAGGAAKHGRTAPVQCGHRPGQGSADIGPSEDDGRVRRLPPVIVVCDRADPALPEIAGHRVGERAGNAEQDVRLAKPPDHRRDIPVLSGRVEHTGEVCRHLRREGRQVRAGHLKQAVSAQLVKQAFDLGGSHGAFGRQVLDVMVAVEERQEPGQEARGRGRGETVPPRRADYQRAGGGIDDREAGPEPRSWPHHRVPSRTRSRALVPPAGRLGPVPQRPQS